MNGSTPDLRRTSLFDWHESHGATLVDFAVHALHESRCFLQGSQDLFSLTGSDQVGRILSFGKAHDPGFDPLEYRYFS